MQPITKDTTYSCTRINADDCTIRDGKRKLPQSPNGQNPTFDLPDRNESERLRRSSSLTAGRAFRSRRAVAAVGMLGQFIALRRVFALAGSDAAAVRADGLLHGGR